MIRRLLSPLFCLAALLCGLGGVAFAAGQPGDPPSLTVGVPADRCPVFYQDKRTGEVTGIGVDLMRIAAEKAGYKPIFKIVRERTLKDALDNESYDVVMPFGGVIKSTAGAGMVVSDNLIQTAFTLVVVNRELTTMQDLRVGMHRSIAAAAEIVQKLYPGIQITLFDSMDAGVRALRAGKVDALLHNSYVWSYVLQKPSYSGLVVQPEAMFAMDFRAGARDTEAGREIISRLNGGIRGLTDTRRHAIVLDHTSRRLYEFDFADYLYLYGRILLLGALLFAALIVIVLLKQRNWRLEQDEKMRRLLDHDPLTGVLSMKGFRKRVEQILRAHPEKAYLISYNNIKNFKYINDSLGMAAGDEILRFWAQKSMEVLSENEAIGRIEGDHFVVLRLAGSDEQMKIDERHVFVPLQNYFINKGTKFRVQICSGIYVLTPQDYVSPDVDHMLDFARVAEERVRQTRSEGFEFYNPEQWEKGKRIAEIVSHVTEAIQAGEIRVWYQPQVNFATGKVSGAEALCRWKHSELGWIPPLEFIPPLEASGTIYELDRYVWETVCRDLQRWNAQGKYRSVSVNLSRSDVREDRDIPKLFLEMVRSHGISADQLRIEITESAYVKDSALLLQTTAKLRELGFQVEMDDFGSGYSSLHMLKDVPVDRIKLDLKFLTRTGDIERGRVIVRFMIQMVKALGMDLIAEGVEFARQAEFLMSHGCFEMQGYYFFKPMPVEEFEQLPESISESRS
ncbi:MAG TPA: diguanylate cyclase [Sutterella sp.]|nr:diguanylate cyclase [Sutterella sp.]